MPDLRSGGIRPNLTPAPIGKHVIAHGAKARRVFRARGVWSEVCHAPLPFWLIDLDSASV